MPDDSVPGRLAPPRGGARFESARRVFGILDIVSRQESVTAKEFAENRCCVAAPIVGRSGEV
ncbi:MAG TPA: hypothetical protein VK869_11250 [Rubrobacteraceae bacterium]|nr:hypothetical protein [Rubrobacteraceae bacterium]